MNVLILLTLQSVLATASTDDPLPRFDDLESPAVSAQPQGEPYPWLGLEAMAVWTNFESGLRIKDVWGYGADFTVTLDYGKKSYLGFRAGYLGWNTRTDASSVPEDGVWVRQYRIGIFGAFNFRFLELRIGATTGGYRYRRDDHNDTAGFFEFEAAIGLRPNEFIWFGIRGMQTFTVTNFNHTNNHAYTNYSVGPTVELRF